MKLENSYFLISKLTQNGSEAKTIKLLEENMWVNLSEIRQWFHRYNTKSISNKREKYINWEFTRIKNICASKYTIKKVKRGTYIPGGPRVKNLPADVGDKDSVPGLGKSHMLWGNQAPASPCAQSLCSKSSLCSKGSLCCKKPQHCNRAAPLAATRENPCTATETQCSRTWINKSHTHTHTHTHKTSEKTILRMGENIWKSYI